MIEIRNIIISENVETVLNDLSIQTGNVHGMKRTGRSIYLNCPFHSDGRERTASLSVNLETFEQGGRRIKAGTFHCLGCNERGRMDKLISRILGFEDNGVQGLKWVVQNYSISERIDQPFFEEEETEEFDFEPELEQYRFVHSYVTGRGVSEAVIDFFDIGFDREAEAVTFPIQDERGAVQGIQRRKIKFKQYLNPTGLNKGDFLYGFAQVRQYADVIEDVYIVEGIFDCLVLWSNRIPAVSILGAIPSEKQIELIKKLPVKSVVLCLDNDRAGNDGSNKLYQALKGTKLLFKAVLPKPVKDVAELPQTEFQNIKKIIMF